MLKGKRIFVSGGSGVIGHELVSMLHDKGAIVFVGDLVSRPLDWPEDILYRQGDLNYITKEELDNFAPEIFFHLAASFERSTETYDFWDENFSNNVDLSHHLMTLLKDSPSLKKVVFASSYLIYNQDLYNFEEPASKPYPLKETDPIYPRNLTGCAKLNHEIELKFIEEFKGDKLQIILARIYRSYGKNSRDIVSRWVRDLLADKEITVYHKEDIFDYVYAGDVAEGLLRLSETDFAGIVNLATGNSRPVSDILVILKKYFPNMHFTDKEFDKPYEGSQADVTLLKKLTGWSPKHKLEDAIPKIIDFEKKHTIADFRTKPHVLITSLSKKIPLAKAVRKALNKYSQEGKLSGADIDQECIGRYFVDDFWVMPKTKDENFNVILKYCKDNKVTGIIPTRDGELMFWSRNKKRLEEENIHVMVSDPEIIDIAVDKLAFYQKCHHLDFPAIETVAHIDDLDCDSYVVKEKFGAGSKSIGINLTQQEAIKHATNLESPIYQPYIKGRELSVDLYVTKKGKAKGAVARERNLVINGESQITTTVANSDLEKVCIEMAEKLGLYGHVIFQVLIDDQNYFHIIECNARFGGASTTGLAAGLDSFYWFLLENDGVDVDDYLFLPAKSQIKQVRFAEDLIVNEN